MPLSGVPSQLSSILLQLSTAGVPGTAVQDDGAPHTPAEQVLVWTPDLAHAPTPCVHEFVKCKLLSIKPSQLSSILLQVSVTGVPGVTEQEDQSVQSPRMHVFDCVPVLKQAPVPTTHACVDGPVQVFRTQVLPLIS